MNENGVTQQYEALSSKLTLLPFARSEDLDINNYVVGKALDGFFYMLAQEERKIRTNPAASTDLLNSFLENRTLTAIDCEAAWGFLKIKP